MNKRAVSFPPFQFLAFYRQQLLLGDVSQRRNTDKYCCHGKKKKGRRNQRKNKKSKVEILELPFHIDVKIKISSREFPVIGNILRETKSDFNPLLTSKNGYHRKCCSCDET